MSHRVLVIVLDGASFVMCNTFLWYMPAVKYFFHSYRRTLMFIDDVPNTPCVLNTMFSGKYSIEHGVYGFRVVDGKPCTFGVYTGKYIWDIAIEKGFNVKVMNVPVRIPPIYINVDLGELDWIDALFPPKEKFREVVEKYHRLVIENIRGEWDLFIVWYPIPDQAHHHFFPTIHNEIKFREFTYWYNKAFQFAKELIDIAKPKYFLIVSDHGFASDFEKIEIDGYPVQVHLRDALAISNRQFLPRKPIEVYYWIKNSLGILYP